VPRLPGTIQNFEFCYFEVQKSSKVLNNKLSQISDFVGFVNIFCPPLSPKVVFTRFCLTGGQNFNFSHQNREFLSFSTILSKKIPKKYFLYPENPLSRISENRASQNRQKFVNYDF
jgi:hypothetical protein